MNAFQTVYIRADGQVDPPASPVLRSGDYYTLTSNISSDTPSGGIVIERDNVTLDGAGHTLKGNQDSDGIDLSGRSNVTVKNVKIEQYAYGIWLGDSVNNTIRENNITKSVIGIYLWTSSGNIITGNYIANNLAGMVFYGFSSNTIYLNSFLNNSQQVVIMIGEGLCTETAQASQLESSKEPLAFVTGESLSTEDWDNGSMGNYWSDYLDRYPNATEVDSLGIWDTPYSIPLFGNDRYPLVNPPMIPEFPSLLIPTLLITTTLPAIRVLRKKMPR